MSHAIVPGSFDPMTLGHLDLIRRVAEKYDRVTVAVMINDQKEYLFDTDTRVAIAKATVAKIANVDVVFDNGMLIDLFDRLQADAVCKGWRNDADLQYERKMADWNRAHNPRFCTELFRSEGEHETLSSTEVRRMLSKGESPATVMHPDAIPLIESFLQSDLIKNKHTSTEEKL